MARKGVFGLSPGIELALVSTGKDACELHLWEATPLEYLERMCLQNLLVPGLNVLEGVIVQADGKMAIVTSQPGFDTIPAKTGEIDRWFEEQGLIRVTDAAYYRRDENPGIFDTQAQNGVRADESARFLLG